MGSAYPFPDWKKNQPTPDPNQVGQMLVQRQAMAQQPQQSPEEAGELEPVGSPEQDMDSTNTAGQSSWPSSTQAAMVGAMLRAPGQTVGTNKDAPAIGNKAQLLRLGMSPEEIALLNSTGGANA